MKLIYLKKDILANSKLDHNAIGVYIALRMICEQDEPIKYISINSLCFELHKNTSYTRYTKEKIERGLNQLIENGLITLISKINKSEYIFDLSKLYFNTSKGTTDFYILITADEVRTVCNYSGHIDKFALLRYFVMIIGSISYSTTINDIRGFYKEINNFVGFMPQTYLAEISHISECSAGTYMSILEDLQLLYVYRHSELLWNSETNQISSFVNKYGRFENQELIEYYAKNYESFNNVETVKKMQKKKDANNRRSLKQKYRYLCNGQKYDQATINEIYEYIHSINLEQLQKIEQIESKEKKDYLYSQLLDETVFDGKIILDERDKE